MYGVSAVGAVQATGERLTALEAIERVIAVTDESSTRLCGVWQRFGAKWPIWSLAG
jgi:hypothetical protein